MQVGSAGGDIGSRNVLVVLLGEQRPQHAGEHIARPRGAQPRRGAAGDDHTHMLLIIRESTLRIRLPIGVGRLAHDNRDRTFEQHGGAGELMGPQRPMQWLVLHIRRIHILAPGGEQRGELPGVRG